MNRGFLSLLAMVFLFGSVMNMMGQNRSGKPLFKITVKDGRITGAASLDTTGNSFNIIQGAGDQNAGAPMASGEDENDYIHSKPEKGRSLPWKIEPAHKVLDINNPNVHVKSGTDGDPMEDLIPLNYAPEAGWEVITYQTFEGAFPASGWECFANSGYTDAFWDENSYRSYEGSWSMFCADRGTAAVTPPMAYPMDMDAWAVYGPFDLSDATYAELDLMLWLDSESGYDFFQYMVSTDGINFYGYQISGSSDGWSNQNMDLTNVPTIGDLTGASSVYFALIFESDYSISFEGAFVDEVLLQKYVEDPAGPDLWWSSLTLSSSSWIPGNAYTADLTVNNLGGISAGAHYSRIFLSEDDLISLEDIQLGGDLYFSSIDAAASSTYTGHEFTVPDLADGSYYVGALVDVFDDVSETDETNNAGARSARVNISENPESDLAPLSMSVSESQWVIGSTIYSDITEENLGGLDAASHESMVVMSVDSDISISDVQLGPLVTFPGIDAGSSFTVNASWQVPDVAQGSYYLGLVIDVNDDVIESDESNNIGIRNGTVDVTGTPEPEIHVTPTSLTIVEPVVDQTQQIDQGDFGPVKKSVGLSSEEPFVPDQVLVRFKGRPVSNDYELFSSKYKLSVLKEMRKPGRSLKSQSSATTLLLHLEHDGNMQERIRELMEMDIVEHAEPNYLFTHDDDLAQEYEPDDPLFQYQWGLKNTANAVAAGGGLVGSPGSDINATNAWDITTGSSNIIVAVIDDGIDPNHPEFIGKIVNGYDFVEGDTDPSCEDGDFHGNACAGIIAAADDGLGTVGVAPGVRLMPLRVCNSVDCSSSDIIDAVYYAVDHGARVISISLGGDSFSSFMQEAINYAVYNHVLVFASAGNGNEDNTFNPHYPSGYANCISVGAMSPCGERKTPSTCDGETWWGSNYGDLDFLTPGTRIYSTDLSGAAGYSPGDYITLFNGTSAACPHAAGVAALLLSLNPGLSALQVRQYMQEGSVDIGAEGYDAQSGYGRLDAYLGLQLVQSGGLDQFIISNQGNAALTVSSISDDRTWMTLSHSSLPRILHPGETMLVEVQVDWDLISAAETGHININSDDEDEGTVVVDVTASPNDVETCMISAEANPVAGGFIGGTGEKGLNQDVILIANPAPNYNFVNWTENGNVVFTDPVYSFVATGDRHLVANFELKSFTISVSASPESGGTVSGTGTYEYGSMATLTATAETGYEFTNWTVGGTVVSTDAVYSFTVTGNLALSANFSTEYYSITASVDPVGSGSVSGTGAYTHNQTVHLQASAASGYVFDEWAVEGNAISGEARYSFAATEDLHLTARFSVKSLSVSTISNPANAGTTSGGGTYPYGSLVTLLATPAAGYEFVNWTIDNIEVSASPGYDFHVYQNTVLVANYKSESEISIQTISIPPEGGITAGGGQYEYGDLVILAAVPAEGQQLAFWIDEDNVVLSDNNPYAFTAIEDALLKAVFVPEINTGTEALVDEHAFVLYPNPVGDYLYVKSGIDLGRSAEISLYDLQGKVIGNYKALRFAGDVFEINTSLLSPGMYFIRITSAETDTRLTGKVIKK